MTSKLRALSVILLALAVIPAACGGSAPSESEVTAEFDRMQAVPDATSSLPGGTDRRVLALSSKVKEVASIMSAPSASAATRQAADRVIARTTRQLANLASRPQTQTKMWGNVRPVPDGLYQTMFTHQVAIIYTGFTNPVYGLACGGALIDSSWILTAAHCFTEENKPGDFQIYAGAATLSAGGHVVAIASSPTGILRHPLYDARTKAYDIALVKLASPIVGLTPIGLRDAAAEQTVMGQTTVTTLSGWGDDGTGMAQDRLLYANPPMVATSACQAKFNVLPPGQLRTILGATMVCAGDGTSDACSGDSGDPLLMQSAGGHYLEGLASWGAVCTPLSPARLPGVYTRVPPLVSWVKCSQGQGTPCS